MAQVLLTFILISCVILPVSITIKSVPLQPAQPEIWLQFLAEVDSVEVVKAEEGFRTRAVYHSDFVSKNKTDYVVFDDTSLVVFACQAKYPVIWNVTNPDSIGSGGHYDLETTSQRVAELFPNQLQPINKHFETFLTISFRFLKFFSVNFTCSAGDQGASPNHTSFVSSIHVFLSGKQAIEKRDETIQVYVPPTKQQDTSGADTIIFPCRPATPNVSILLEKQVQNKNNPNRNSVSVKWVRFKYPTKFVNFDPKVGFIMTKDPMGKRKLIFGLFRCTALSDHQSKENGSQVVYINVTADTLRNGSINEIADYSKFENTLWLAGNASVSYNDKAYEPQQSDGITDLDIRCCSGVPNRPPQSFDAGCHDHLQCQLLKRQLLRQMSGKNKWNCMQREQLVEDSKDCVRLPFYSPSIVVSCQGDTVKFQESFIQVFRKNIMSVRNRRMKGMRIYEFVTERETQRISSSQKSLIIFAYAEAIEQLQFNDTSPQDLANKIVFDFTATGRDILHSMDDDFDGNDNNFWRQPDAHFEHFVEYPSDAFYEGEPLTIICIGLKFWHASGVHSSIVWKNGSRSVVASKASQQTTVLSFNKEIITMGLSPRHLIYRFGVEEKAKKEMTSVECWLPQWNSQGWDKVSRPLTILKSTLPTFADGKGNNTEQLIYFYKGEPARLQIKYEVHGTPPPSISITKDGQILPKYDSVRSNLTSKFNISWNFAVHTHGNSVEDGKNVATVIITFNKTTTTNEIQGIYQCTLANVKGTVVRTVKVIVTERRNWLLPILIAAVVLLVVLLAVMGLWLCRRQRIAQTLRISN